MLFLHAVCLLLFCCGCASAAKLMVLVCWWQLPCYKPHVHYQPCMHVSLMEMDGFLCRQHHTNVALACWIIEAVIACLPVLLISWWQVHKNQRKWSIVYSTWVSHLFCFFSKMCIVSHFMQKNILNWSTFRNVIKIVVTMLSMMIKSSLKIIPSNKSILFQSTGAIVFYGLSVQDRRDNTLMIVFAPRT